MNAQQQGIITLIKSALDGSSYTLPEGFDMADAVKVALRHKIIAMVYYGALNCGINKKSEPMQELFRYLIATMNITEKQRFEIKKLFAAFDEQGIEYLPMKGTLLQRHYPKAEMRTMGDADILIRLEQYEKIRIIMATLGYEFDYESDHELVWKKSRVVIELHKCVIPTYETDYYAYFGDGWKLAKRESEEGGRYVLSPEDFYIYIFVHFAKHYRMAGIGIKHMVDLWVYRNTVDKLDDGYINQQLAQMDLLAFHQNIIDTMNAWFRAQELTDKADYITQVIFDSGEYGLSDSQEATRILRRVQQEGSIGKVRRRDFWSMAFPCLTVMREKYPVLVKLPILLPIFWCVRWVQSLLFKRDKVKKYVRQKRVCNNEAVEQYKQALNFVGLDYYEEEKE